MKQLFFLFALSLLIFGRATAQCFLNPVTYNTLNSDYLENVATGDFNGDGYPDIVTTNGYDGTVSVLLNNGDGSFGAATKFGAGAQASGIAVGDLNGDNKLDLAIANIESYDVSILLGNGTGGFAPKINVLYHELNLPNIIAIGDLNGDGKPDLAVYENRPSRIVTALGDGTGHFSSKAVHNFATSVESADGIAFMGKIFSENYDRSVFLNLGSTTLGASCLFVANQVISDFNGDGKLDLATGASISLNNGSGGFSASTSYPTVAGGFTTGDFNLDGKPDLAGVSRLDNIVSILGNNGSGGLEAPVNFTVANRPASVAVADFNLDGKSDLVVASGEHTVSVFLNCTIPPSNTSPIVSNFIPDQSNSLGAAFSYTIPSNTFTDKQTPNNLTVTVSGLPTGLTFTSPATISGTTSQIGESVITVTSTDPGNLSITTSFKIKVAPLFSNTAPTVSNLVPNQTAVMGNSFSYAIPTNTFTDLQTPTELIISVTGLSPGLSFIPPATIGGSPSQPGESTIVVTATDPGGLAANTSFKLSVAMAPLTIHATTPITFCAGGTVSLTASGCPSIGGLVTWNDGTTGSTFTSGPLSPNAGTQTEKFYNFTATCTYNNVTSAQVSAPTVRVNYTPNAPLTATSNVSSTPPNEPVTLTATAENNTFPYMWTWNNGYTGLGNPITLTPVITTDYTVFRTNGECISAAGPTVRVTVVIPPKISILESTTTQICATRGTATPIYFTTAGNFTEPNFSVILVKVTLNSLGNPIQTELGEVGSSATSPAIFTMPAGIPLSNYSANNNYYLGYHLIVKNGNVKSMSHSANIYLPVADGIMTENTSGITSPGQTIHLSTPVRSEITKTWYSHGENEYWRTGTLIGGESGIEIDACP